MCLKHPLENRDMTITPTYCDDILTNAQIAFYNYDLDKFEYFVNQITEPNFLLLRNLAMATMSGDYTTDELNRLYEIVHKKPVHLKWVDFKPITCLSIDELKQNVYELLMEIYMLYPNNIYKNIDKLQLKQDSINAFIKRHPEYTYDEMF